MGAKISEDLAAAFSREGVSETHRERVIITLNDKAAADAMAETAGIKVINRMQSLPMIVAEIDASGLSTLASDPAIQRVEPDGEMRALPE